MTSFVENLAQLPIVDAVTLRLVDVNGCIAASIKNQPGTQGSFQVYAYVAKKWGAINPDAASEALVLYAEHTEDARQHPGKHPNIDRLFQVIGNNSYYDVRFERD